jgi:2,5-diamino-6-(ribosylamino)-4(3H)-pyrimidinone 5'-phosphate reductase
VLNGQAKTLIATNESCTKTFPGAEVVRFGKDLVDIKALIEHLERRGIRTLLVEGGEMTMWSFFREGLVDEVSVFVGSMIIGGRESPTLAGGEGFSTLDETTRLKLKSCERLGDGALLRYDVIK